MGSVDLVGENKDDPMSLAFAEARSAELRGEAPIGAALVREGTVIASAGNRTRELNDPTAHAEMIVIREAAAKDWIRTAGRLRSLCDARALRDVRRRDLLRPPAPALLRRSRPQGRRCRQRPALLSPAHLPPRARGLRGLTRERGGRDAASVFRREAVSSAPLSFRERGWG